MPITPKKPKTPEDFIAGAKAEQSTKKGKGGRPAIPEEEKSKSFLNVYFTKDEKKRVQEHMKKMRTNFSQYVKMLLAEKGII